VKKATLMRSGLYGLYFFILIVILLCAISGAIFILSANYDSLIVSVAATMHKNGLEEKIRNGVFTRNRFVLLQTMSWLVFIVAPFCFWLAVRFRLLIMSYCKFFIDSVLQSLKAVSRIFKDNTKQQNRGVFALLFIIATFFIYRIIASHISYDEQWCYNYYTDNYFYYSFFTYSSYPLFELTTHFFKWFPFPMQINLRLSPFIFTMASCFLLYACIRKYFNSHFIAMGGLATFAFTPLTVLYTAFAKGAVHELFFAIAGIFSLLFWLRNTEYKKYLAIYFIAGVLGLYSMMPHILFLFFLMLAGLWFLVRKKISCVFLFIKINIVILGCYLIIYSPILLTTGLSVLGGVVKTAPSYNKVFLNLPLFIHDVITDYAGHTQLSLILFMVAIIAIVLLKSKLSEDRQLILIIAVGLPVSTAFFYIIGRFPFAGRSLAFGALSIPLMSCLFLELAMPWLNKHNVLKRSMGFSAIALALVLHNYFYIPVNPVDADITKVAGLFINNKVISCYDNSVKESHFFVYYPGIEYYYRLKNKAIEFTLVQKNSMRYKPLLTTDSYDCIVYDFAFQDSSRIASYHQLYNDTNKKFTIWIRNGLK